MAQNEDNHTQGTKSLEHHSDGSSTHRSPSLQKELNFNNEHFQMEEQAHVEFEEAERRAEELRERLRLIHESRRPEDRGENPDYTRVIAEN